MTDLLIAVLYVLKDISAAAGILAVMRFIFSEKISLNVPKCLLIIAATVINAGVGVYALRPVTADFDSVMDFVSDVIYIAAVFAVTGRNSPVRKILTVFIFIYTCDMVWAVISSYSGMNLLVEYAVHILIFAAVILLIFLLARKSGSNILPMVFNRIPGFVYFIILLFELTCYYKEYGVSSEWYKALYSVSSVGIILCVLYVIFRVFTMTWEQNRILEQLNVQAKQISENENRDEELRRFRHDYKNHMTVVSSMLSDGRTEEARKYLESVTGGVSTGRAIKTGNFTADAIINNKSSSVEGYGVTIKFYGFIPPDGIDSKDICTVISNLLDNAVDAVLKSESDKIITMEANVSGGCLILSISNPAIGLKLDKNGKPVTSKLDKKNHGIGLRNVERTVEKYKGALLTEYENGIFTADLRMKII